MLTLRLLALDARVWFILTLLLVLVARCDDYSTYPKG